MPYPSPPPTSYLAFLLSAILEEKGFPTAPNAEGTVAYCVELANLRIDFERMEDSPFRFWGLIDTMEEDDSALGLLLKKFLVVYTEDNAVLRVHAYRERVFQLTNAALTLRLPEKPERSQKFSFNDEVSRILRERGHLALIRQLESFTSNKPPAIRDALERRNEFVHRIPTREWMSLRGGAQLQDWLDFDWETDRFAGKDPVDVALESDNLRRKWGFVLDFLRKVQNELDSFEEGFCALLHEAYCRGTAE
jgi:hypothetical protein